MRRALIITLLLVTVVAGCKKNDLIDQGNTRGGNANDNGSRGRIKSDGFYTYEYDGRGRVKVMNASNGIIKYYDSDSAITEVVHFLNGSISGINLFKLRSNGLVYLRQNGFQTLNTYSTFEYSTSRALMVQVDTFLVGQSKMKYQYYRTGNRIDSIKEIYSNIIHTRIFEYYMDRTNTLTNEAMGKSYLGSGTPNPVKTVIVRVGNNTPVVVANYTYEFDSENRISKQIITRPNFPLEENIITYY